MRYFTLAVLAVVFLATSVLAQGERGSKGQVFNQPKQFYLKTSPTPSTANDTTATYLPFVGGQGGLAIFGSADDSCAALIYYRIRQSKLPYAVTGSWTAIDTLGPAGDGTMATTSGASQLLGTIALATLLGYDEIQFYVDYLTGTSDGAKDGTANLVRFYYYYLKPDVVR